MLFLPSAGPQWAGIAKEFATRGFEPAIWLGGIAFDDFVASSFPDCVVLPLSKFHNEIHPSQSDSAPDAATLRSREFMQLKLQVLKLMDRQDETRSFHKLDREAQFYAMFTSLYTLIKAKKIDLLFSGEAPHAPANLIAYRICQWLSIPTFHLESNTHVPLIQVKTQIGGDGLPVPDSVDISKHLQLLETEFRTYEKGFPTPLYMKNQRDFDKQYSFTRTVYRHVRKRLGLTLKRVLKKELGPSNDYRWRARYPWMSNSIKYFEPFTIRKLQRDLRQRYAEVSSIIAPQSDFPGGYVYFPMPYEPERTSNPDGADFYENMDALLALRHFVPSEVPILVKEHPSQFSYRLKGYQGRTPLHYSAILRLENVVLVNIDAPSSVLIDESAVVVCITGTAALEAALRGRRGVVFGNPWFGSLPGVYKFDSLTTFEDLLNRKSANVDEISLASREILAGVSIPGAPQHTQLSYFKRKFPSDFEQLSQHARTAEAIVSTVISEFDAQY